MLARWYGALAMERTVTPAFFREVKSSLPRTMEGDTEFKSLSFWFWGADHRPGESYHECETAHKNHEIHFLSEAGCQTQPDMESHRDIPHNVSLARKPDDFSALENVLSQSGVSMAPPRADQSRLVRVPSRFDLGSIRHLKFLSHDGDKVDFTVSRAIPLDCGACRGKLLGVHRYGRRYLPSHSYRFRCFRPRPRRYRRRQWAD